MDIDKWLYMVDGNRTRGARQVSAKGPTGFVGDNDSDDGLSDDAVLTWKPKRAASPPQPAGGGGGGGGSSSKRRPVSKFAQSLAATSDGEGDVGKPKFRGRRPKGRVDTSGSLGPQNAGLSDLCALCEVRTGLLPRVPVCVCHSPSPCCSLCCFVLDRCCRGRMEASCLSATVRECDAPTHPVAPLTSRPLHPTRTLAHRRPSTLTGFDM